MITIVRSDAHEFLPGIDLFAQVFVSNQDPPHNELSNHAEENTTKVETSGSGRC